MWVGCPDADDGAVRDVSKPLNDEPAARHLGQPVVVASLGPVVGVVLVSDREDSQLRALPVQLLHS